MLVQTHAARFAAAIILFCGLIAASSTGAVRTCAHKSSWQRSDVPAGCRDGGRRSHGRGSFETCLPLTSGHDVSKDAWPTQSGLSMPSIGPFEGRLSFRTYGSYGRTICVDRRQGVAGGSDCRIQGVRDHVDIASLPVSTHQPKIKPSAPEALAAGDGLQGAATSKQDVRAILP